MLVCPSTPALGAQGGRPRLLWWGYYGGLGPSRSFLFQVQDVVKCQMGVCRADESEDSPDSCKNGQLQILVSERTLLAMSASLSVSRLRREQGRSLGSAIDYRVVPGKPSPHSASSLQFEALLGGIQGGLRSWVGWGLSLSHPDTSLSPLPTCSLPLNL